MISLGGHSALVTGSTKGVGRAIAEAFARAGANVLIHGRAFSDAAREAMTSCEAHGVATAFIAGDLSGPVEAAVEGVFSGAIAARPEVDILVNNAGQYLDLPFLEMTPERFERTMRLNVASGYFLTQRFARHWIDSGVPGRVLFTGSINGRLAEPVSTAYDTSKGAVEMMVKTLAVALAPNGIRVNGLAPGLVRSATTGWLDEQPAKAAWIAHHTPNGRIPDADVCGDGAVYLVSDAASHVHGHMLMIDGGMSVWQHPEPM
jgi:glucose 1-dehydrogenase